MSRPDDAFWARLDAIARLATVAGAFYLVGRIGLGFLL